MVLQFESDDVILNICY